ncbi:hypothetical protein ABT336_00090 [Micromonospora sp. NPDC000207]|uniref:hypothetical protein n=1 Tax=Micromonospora sp. NPDC000207 TaxID=3154246 RepID=UPI00332F2CF6
MESTWGTRGHEPQLTSGLKLEHGYLYLALVLAGAAAAAAGAVARRDGVVARVDQVLARLDQVGERRRKSDADIWWSGYAAGLEDAAGGGSGRLAGVVVPMRRGDRSGDTGRRMNGSDMH